MSKLWLRKKEVEGGEEAVIACNKEQEKKYRHSRRQSYFGLNFYLLQTSRLCICIFVMCYNGFYEDIYLPGQYIYGAAHFFSSIPSIVYFLGSIWF